MDYTFVFISIAMVIGYWIGKSKQRSMFGEKALRVIIDRANFPVAVVEKVNDQYLMYEKDTSNFLCQATTLDKLAEALYEAKRVTMALVYCPQEFQEKKLWIVNGKLIH